MGKQNESQNEQIILYVRSFSMRMMLLRSFIVPFATISSETSLEIILSVICAIISSPSIAYISAVRLATMALKIWTGINLKAAYWSQSDVCLCFTESDETNGAQGRQ